MSLDGNTQALQDLLNAVNELPNAVEVDDTLTGSGKAADAKVTGERIGELSEQIGDLQNKEVDLTGYATVDELDSEIADVQTEIAVERARINTFTRLEEGSTTGDAELMDARVGADGVAYDTLGDAVRTQFANQNEELDEVKKSIGFILVKSKYEPVFESGKYITQNGEIISAGSFQVSKYIDVSTYESITLTTRMGWEHLFYAFYDDDKSFIHGLASPSGGYETIENANVIIPSNAKYIVVSKTNDIAFEMYVEQYQKTDDISERLYDLTEEIDGIRDEVDSLKDTNADIIAVKEILSHGKNLYNRNKKTDGYTLDVHGDTVVSTGHSTSEYIVIDEGEEYTVSHDGKVDNSWLSIVCFYNSDKVFVSYISSPTATFTAPSNVKYLRFATSTERMEGNLQFEKGKSATEYEEYTLTLPFAKQEEVDDIKEKLIESYFAYVSSGSFVSKTNGNIYSGSSYGSTSYIPVTGGESIKIKGFHCPSSTNASVCAYDSDFTFIGTIITGEVDSGDGKIISLDNAVAYIRVTSTNTGKVSVEYIDKAITTNVTEDAPYSLGTLTANCYVSKENGTVLTNTSYYGVTEYIEVTSRNLKIENPNLSGNGSICEYDENYNFVSCVLSDVTSGQYTIHLSKNAKYIRATVVNNNSYWLRLYPVSTMEDDTETNDVLDSWMVATGNQIKNPYKRINSLAPTITFIDDDTMRFDAVKRYHDIFAEKGVKGCYGVITDYLDRDENLKDLLLEYEEEGFGMLFHAKWQDTFYMEGANRDIVEAEKDYVQGIRRMREIGFYDYDYWVSPYGVTDEQIASMCKRHGAKCLLSTSNNTFIQCNGLNGNAESVERYAIPRCSMGYNDTQYPNFTLAHLKEQIDRCVQVNGWVIITTHVQQWADEYGNIPDDRLREIIQYALDSGCEVKTFAEVYAERNSIFMVNDLV